MSMTLEDFYQAFETAHRKYPMQVLSEWSGRKILRHQIDDDIAEDIISEEASLHCGYCPVTAVAKVLADADSPLVRKVSISANFSPNTVNNWAARIGLSDRNTTLIIAAADDEIHISSYPQDDVKIKEIRGRMISICAGNTSEHES